jgi:S1-C subfamily serine protease
MGVFHSRQVEARSDDAMGRYVFADLADRVLPSVVTVYVQRKYKHSDLGLNPFKRFERNPRQLDPFKFFLDPERNDLFRREDRPGEGGSDQGSPEEKSEEQFLMLPSSGSGVIVSEDGYLLTNQHVVGDPDDEPKISIVLHDDTKIDSDDIELIWTHELVDLAVLRIKTKGLKLRPIEWGKSGDLRIGERVAAIGSPLDLRRTITQGIVCADNRDVHASRSSSQEWGGLIQTDAVINPGSSGGPLVNLDGQMVGINRVISSTDGRWQGYGFALPTDDIRHFYNQLIEEGEVQMGYIGVSMINLDQIPPELTEALGLDMNLDGVLVVEAREGEPAQKAGIRKHDFITSVDQQKISSATDLLHMIARKPVGSKVKISVLRGNDNDELEKEEFSFRLSARPSPSELTKMKDPIVEPVPAEEAEPDEAEFEELGISVDPDTEDGEKGLRVTYVDPRSKAAQAGIKEGDLLLELNRLRLKSQRDISRGLERRADSKRNHLFSYIRNGKEMIGVIKQD